MRVSISEHVNKPFESSTTPVAGYISPDRILKADRMMRHSVTKTQSQAMVAQRRGVVQRRLTMISPTITSEETFGFSEKTLAREVNFKFLFKIQGFCSEIIVGEIIVRSPYGLSWYRRACPRHLARKRHSLVGARGHVWPERQGKQMTYSKLLPLRCSCGLGRNKLTRWFIQTLYSNGGSFIGDATL